MSYFRFLCPNESGKLCVDSFCCCYYFFFFSKKKTSVWLIFTKGTLLCFFQYIITYSQLECCHQPLLTQVHRETLVKTHKARRVSGAEQGHSFLKARVKHNRVWSPNGWLIIMCWALRLPWDFSRVKFCADSIRVLWMRWQTKVPRVYPHAKRSRTHAKYPVVRVSVWCTMETTK